MDPDESRNNLASLKQSIQDSEATLRQLRQTIEVVDARLRHAEWQCVQGEGNDRYLNAAAGGG